MQKYIKYIFILSITVMLTGAGLFAYELTAIPNDINMDIVIEEEAVPLGLWEGEEEAEEEIDDKTVYTDIAEHWAKDDIMYVIENEIMSPINDTEFKPGAYITRAAFVTTLGRVENIDITDRVVKTFKDIDASKYYAPYVSWAEEKNILDLDDSDFRPNDNITREEVAVILCNYLEKVRGEILTSGITFTDFNSISTEARDKVMLITGSEYLNGRKDGTFDPNKEMTRAELATILAKMMRRLDL